MLAAAYGQLGEKIAAGRALRELLTLQGDFARSGREGFARWFEAPLVDHLLDGLRKAGLDLP